jgi:hypothetical protein
MVPVASRAVYGNPFNRSLIPRQHYPLDVLFSCMYIPFHDCFLSREHVEGLSEGQCYDQRTKGSGDRE